jgi:toxin ParE1/3/4
MAFYRLADPAKRDVKEIKDYIAADNREAAKRLVRALTEKFAFLSQNPTLFAPQVAYGGLRKCGLGNYLIFYRSVKGGIQIMRVLHGARDLQKLLKTFH